MNTLPPELLLAVVDHIPETDPYQDASERKSCLTPSSRTNVCNSRLVCMAFKDASKRAFIRVLNETPFNISRTSMAKLEELSKSRYAKQICTLNWCGLWYSCQFVNGCKPDPWELLWLTERETKAVVPSRQYLVQNLTSLRRTRVFEHLKEILKQFPNIKDLVYQPAGSRSGNWRPHHSLRAGPSGNTAPVAAALLDRPAETIFDSARTFGTLIDCFHELSAEDNIKLETISTTLFANQSGNTAIWPDSLVNASRILKGPALPAVFQHLKHLSISLAYSSKWSPMLQSSNLLSHFLSAMTNLETLEISFARLNIADSHRAVRMDFMGLHNVDNLTKLCELRLMAHPKSHLKRDHMLQVLHSFRHVKRLALGYITLADGAWSEILQWIAMSMKLESLCLLNPHDVVRDRETRCAMDTDGNKMLLCRAGNVGRVINFAGASTCKSFGILEWEPEMVQRVFGSCSEGIGEVRTKAGREIN